MKICIHGKAAEGCPFRVPYGIVWGCVNVKRAVLDIEWCGKTPEECKGRHDVYLGKKDNGHNKKS